MIQLYWQIYGKNKDFNMQPNFFIETVNLKVAISPPNYILQYGFQLI